MRHLAAMWGTLYPAEQQRLARLLIERVVLGETIATALTCTIGNGPHNLVSI